MAMMLALAACTRPPAGGSGGFSLSLEPANLILQQGQSRAVTVRLSRAEGFEEVVTFSLLGAPKGMTGSFTPASTSGDSSTLNLSVASTNPGSYDLSVKGTAGGLERVATLQLRVEASPTPPPASGSLDETFGDGGRVIYFRRVGIEGRALALLPDGKIVVGGTLRGSTLDGILARFDARGGHKDDAVFDRRLDDEFNALAVDAEGRLVAVGRSVGDGERSNFALVRFLPNSFDLDRDFGTDGVASFDFGNSEIAHAVAIQPDGKLVVAGMGFQSFSNSFDFTVARYTEAGALDPEFGPFTHPGVQAFDFSTGFDAFDRALGVALSPDEGLILTVGLTAERVDSETLEPQVSDLAIAQSTDNGIGVDRANIDLEPELGGPVDVAQAVQVVAVDGQRKSLVTGFNHDPTTGTSKAFLMRLTPSGSRDPSFGDNGLVVVAGQDTRATRAFALTVQADGKIVLVGSVASLIGGPKFLVARFLPNSRPDSSFGNGGLVVTGFEDLVNSGSRLVGAEARAVLIQDGKILVAGTVTDARGNTGIALARYHP